MLKLLDPVHDAKEIAELQDMKSEMNEMGRSVTPILIPLEDRTELSDLIAPGAGVEFDLDGSGLPRKWGWITPQAAWLVFASNGEGPITSGLQMFGNVTFWIFWQNGYEALRSLDADGNGILRGDEMSGLALWRDKNSNGKSDPGEIAPLSDYGVSSLSCHWENHSTGIPWSPQGVTFTNGSSRPSYDWILRSE